MGVVERVPAGWQCEQMEVPGWLGGYTRWAMIVLDRDGKESSNQLYMEWLAINILRT